MASLSKKRKNRPDLGLERSLLTALAGFEMDSRQACRALQVSIALNVFGVGTLLPNELPGESLMLDNTERMESMTVH